VCPRCQTPVRVKSLTSEPKRRTTTKPRPEPEVDELELEKAEPEEMPEQPEQENGPPAEEETQDRDWTRL
ncbi:MAG TPA: hypothetical protein VLH13_03770, partial [Methanomassiliicoccales archaeon]|nr:hypothetical protein [Methanomassiliicoccales archaeon]